MNLRTSCRNALMRATLATLLLAPGAARLAAQEAFPATHIAVLQGEKETPPVTPITDAGVGIGIFRYDPVAKSLEYRITVTFPPTDTITGAHFHLGPEGTQGQIIHDIPFPNTTRTVTGTWSNIADSVLLPLQGGSIYVNVHTKRHPAGQIRSQVVLIPTLSAESIDPSQEVPPSTNSTGSGGAFVWLNLANRTASYDVKWNGLTGAPTMAHFHKGAPGQKGPVVHPIDLPQMAQPTGEAIGTWGNLSDGDIADLIAGRLYVNLHTAQYPDGEIRGQVETYEVFSAAISPTNEVPPASSSTAQGTGAAVLHGGKKLTASFVVEGTTGPISMAHIHRGAIGENGPIVFNLAGFVTAWGTDSLPVTPDQAILFRTKGLYANFHTAAFGGGEARGQLIPAATNLPLPTTGVRYVLPEAGTGALSASYDGTALRFSVDPSVGGGEREVVLYSLLGERIASTELLDDRGAISVGSLASGSYIAELRVKGSVVAVRRIGIVR